MEAINPKYVSRVDKNGVLKRKEVFRWSVDSTFIRNGMHDVRSDFFDFKPYSNSKFCLLLANNFKESTVSIVRSNFSIFLCRISSGCSEHFPIKVSFSLLGFRDKVQRCCETVMKENDWVYATFDRSDICSHSLLFFGSSGKLKVQCVLDMDEIIEGTNSEVNGTVSVSPSKMPDEITAKASVLVDDLSSLLKNETLCDTVLRADGKDFQVHRAILAARSPVFAAMFQHDTLEKAQNRVIIEDISTEVMPQFLRYLYTDEMDNLTSEQWLSLFLAADKYLLPNLKNKCADFLCANLTVDIVLKVLIAANMLQDENLKEAAFKAVIDNIVQVMQTDEWLMFLKDYSEIANSIMLRLVMK